jgi:hypothetical protein
VTAGKLAALALGALLAAACDEYCRGGLYVARLEERDF